MIPSELTTKDALVLEKFCNSLIFLSQNKSSKDDSSSQPYSDFKWQIDQGQLVFPLGGASSSSVIKKPSFPAEANTLIHKSPGHVHTQEVSCDTCVFIALTKAYKQ